MKRKVGIGILLIVCAILGYFLYKESKLYNHLLLPTYTYLDMGKYGYDHITIEGTWVSDDPSQELANQLATVKFNCDKREGICREIQADASTGFLSIYTNESKITDWNENFISADTTGDPNACVYYTYRIDRFEQKLNARRIRNKETTSPLCEGIGWQDWPLHMEDGFKVISKLRGYK